MPSTYKKLKKAANVHTGYGHYCDYEFFIRNNSVTVQDNGCQMSRTYIVGQIQELNDFEQELIKSTNQVINAWKSGSVWF